MGCQPLPAFFPELFGFGQVSGIGASRGYAGEDGVLGDEKPGRDDREALFLDSVAQFAQGVVVVAVAVDAGDDGGRLFTVYLFQCFRGRLWYAAGVDGHDEEDCFAGRDCNGFFRSLQQQVMEAYVGIPDSGCGGFGDLSGRAGCAEKNGMGAEDVHRFVF